MTQASTITQATFSATDYQGTGPENYERYFVPAIGAPLANDLVARENLPAPADEASCVTEDPLARSHSAEIGTNSCATEQ